MTIYDQHLTKVNRFLILIRLVCTTAKSDKFDCENGVSHFSQNQCDTNSRLLSYELFFPTFRLLQTLYASPPL